MNQDAFNSESYANVAILAGQRELPKTKGRLIRQERVPQSLAPLGANLHTLTNIHATAIAFVRHAFNMRSAPLTPCAPVLSHSANGPRTMHVIREL